MIQVPIYSQGSTHTQFEMKLLDSDNPYNAEPLDLSSYSTMRIIFHRPDGVEVVKTATPADSSRLTNTYITYTDTAGDLLTMKGYWQYYASVTYADGRVIESSSRLPFWVV